MSVLSDILRQRADWSNKCSTRLGPVSAAVLILVQWVVPLVLLSLAIVFRHDVMAFVKAHMPYVL